MSHIPEFKIAYYKEGNINLLCSDFFDKFEDALQFSSSLSVPFLIFRKDQVKGDHYSWELMPYGAHSAYRTFIQILEHKWILLILAVFAIYAIVQLKKSSPNG
jgi:hypothetical protein